MTNELVLDDERPRADRVECEGMNARGGALRDDHAGDDRPWSAKDGDDEPTTLLYRARTYRALGELLRTGPTMRALGEAKAILGDELLVQSAAAPAVTLYQAIEAASVCPVDQWRQSFSSIRRRCSSPRHDDRLWACVFAEVIADDSRTTDLVVLATMAEEIDWTLRRGRNGTFAAAMRERRSAFLMDHALACLRPLSRDLLDSPVPVLASMGAALRMLLAAEPIDALAEYLPLQ